MKAAKQNNPWAQCNLGFCYASGIGVPENPQKAIYWYRKAAQQNHARAQDKLGVHLQAGIGCRQNLEMAVHYFRLSAQQDQVAAQYHLALCYEKGLGTPVNLEEALKWFERAATVSFYHLVFILLLVININLFRLVAEIPINVFVNYYYVIVLKMHPLLKSFKESIMPQAVGLIALTRILLVGYLVSLLLLLNFFYYYYYHYYIHHIPLLFTL